MGFLQPFCEFSTVSALVFLCFLLSPNIKINKVASCVGFTVSFAFSILVLYSNKARLALIVYVLIVAFSMIDILVSRKHNYLIKCAILVVSVALMLKVSSWLGRGAQSTVLDTISSGVSYVFNNFFFWYNNLDFSSLRWMFDYIIAFIFILPSRIWASIFGIRTISQMNTFAQFGAYKGSKGITGEIPMDFVSCAYCQLGLIGMAVIGYLSGVLLRKLESKLAKCSEKSVRVTIRYYIIFEVIFRSVLNGDPEAIITRLFPAICFILILKVLDKKTISAKSGIQKNKSEAIKCF